MKRTLLALAVWAAIGIDFASAQFTLGQAPPRVRPTVNPAINLGAGGAFSYYGYIKPQADATRTILGLQQTLNQMNVDGSLQGQMEAARQATQQQGQAAGAVGLQTGHPVTYFNYSHYYPAVPPGGGASLGGTSAFGGLGGFAPGIGGGLYGTGFGGLGNRTFFQNTLRQGFQP